MEKIFFYTDDITYVGGVERVIINLSNEFIKKNRVIIISNAMNSEIKYEYDKRIEFIDLCLNKNFFLTRKLEIIKKMNNILKNEDGIVLGMGAWNATVLAFIKNTKLIKIASEHLAFTKIPKKTMILRKILYRYLDGITILTKHNFYNYKKLKNNVYIIPNYINYNNTLEKAHLINKKVISLGRLESQKGYDLLLKIWFEVEKINKEWILEIYGDGSKKQELLKLKLELKLKNVIFMGETREVEEKLKSASIYVMSSRYEGFGLVLLESLACGVPCIAFDCETGPNDILVDGENGYLIKENDMKNFSEKLLILMNNLELRKKMALNGKGTLLKYSKEKIIEDWYKMFDELKVREK